MTQVISFLKVLFLQSIIYENCLTDIQDDCKYTDFQIVGLSSATLDRCGSDPGNLYMGPYGFSTQVSKTFTNIPPNNLIGLQVGIWKLDSWDAEGFKIYANDVLVENLILDFFEGTMQCRNIIWKDKLQPISLKFQITGTDLTIKFIDNLNNQIWVDAVVEDIWDESWGFRDFILRLAVPCVNFYSECDYTGTLFQICKGEYTRSQSDIPFEIKSILMGPGIIVKFKSPNYFAGELQEFTSSQPCMTSFQFTNVVYKE